MPMIPVADGPSLHCAVDDYLWPWDAPMPVVMMHGFARNARFWNRWVPAIAETRRVYRPDLLGCGDSDPPPADYRYTPEAIAAQIIAALDALGLERVHWVGESSGGIIGVLLAAAHPGRIASLVLCNTPGRISDEIKRIYALDRESASAAMRAYGVGEWCRQTLGYRLDLEQADPRLCRIGSSPRWTAPGPISPPRCTTASRRSTRSRCSPASRCRCCCCAATKSRIAAAQQRALAERLPQARLDLVEGYGHGVNLLLPERCARASLDFWRAIELG